MEREIRVSTSENTFEIYDVIKNTGDRVEPVEILYHMNMGYPLLDENSVVRIPSVEVKPRDDHAAEDIENWMHINFPAAKGRHLFISQSLAWGLPLALIRKNWTGLLSGR